MSWFIQQNYDINHWLYYSQVLPDVHILKNGTMVLPVRLLITASASCWQGTRCIHMILNQSATAWCCRWVVKAGEGMFVSHTGRAAAHGGIGNANILAVERRCTAEPSIHRKGQSVMARKAQSSSGRHFVSPTQIDWCFQVHRVHTESSGLASKFSVRQWWNMTK